MSSLHTHTYAFSHTHIKAYINVWTKEEMHINEKKTRIEEKT